LLQALQHTSPADAGLFVTGIWQDFKDTKDWAMILCANPGNLRFIPTAANGTLPATFKHSNIQTSELLNL